jgi:hypothetical protein
LISAVLSSYHLLVIGGFVNDWCSVRAKVERIEDFMAVLNAPIPCSKAGWKVFGIPVAAFNAFVSTVFVYFCTCSGKKNFRVND